MNDIDIKRITAYNNECNTYKQKLAQLLAERKILQDNINQQCAQLSQQLGVEVTLDNIEQIYNDKAASIANILESGEAILRRIKAAENGEIDEAPVETPNQPVQTAGFGQPAQQGGFSQQGGFGQPAGGFGGMPTSDFKMPEKYMSMMPGQQGGFGQPAQPAQQGGFGQPAQQVVRPSNSFAQANAFNGSFRSIQVAPSNDNDVDEV